MKVALLDDAGAVVELWDLDRAGDLFGSLEDMTRFVHRILEVKAAYEKTKRKADRQ